MQRFVPLASALAATTFALLHAGFARADTYEISASDDLFTRLQSLAPGDEVIVHGGTYVTPGFFEVTWSGTSERPIVVRAADGEAPVIQGALSQNVINLSGAHFTLRGFEIKGGSHGLRLGDVAHATLEDLVLHELGDVGISCNRPGTTCDDLTIRHNEIFATGTDGGTGEGMYLGCDDASCTFKSSVVEGNYVHDMGGSQGDGIEVKTGSFGNVVRDNAVVRTIYPAITMYGFAGDGLPNVVERNFINETGDNGIQVVGQVIVRNNVVFGAGVNGIHSKPSPGSTPHDLSILHNTVVGAQGACLKTNGWSTEIGQLVLNNALYCAEGTAVDFNGGAGAAAVAGNRVLGSSNAGSGVSNGDSAAADFVDVVQYDVYPRAGSALVNAGEVAGASTEDFNGSVRGDGQPDVGAYERSASDNPGWAPADGFKDLPVNAATDGDASAPDDASVADLDASAMDASATADVDASATPEPSADDHDAEAAASGGSDADAMDAADAASPRRAASDSGCSVGTRRTKPWLLGVLLTAGLALRRRRGQRSVHEPNPRTRCERTYPPRS